MHSRSKTTRAHRRPALALLGLLSGLAAPAVADVPQVETVEYTITRGDTCSGIARRLYGDGERWDIIHEFNPRLGPALPHRLVPGETLTLPPTLPPDAWVTEVVQRVEHRPGSVEGWQPARDGTPLTTGYRVSTYSRSAAELTFRDASRVEMHQNTLLVIFGRTARETTRTANRVRLARGTLRSRLAGLRGEASTMRVESASGVAALTAGEALLSADDGASAVSNHGGDPVQVSGLGGRGTVAVSTGMGTTVRKGQSPAPPRPLPPAPVWSAENPRAAWGATADAAVFDLAWAPTDGVGYRIELSRGDARFAAADLPPDPPSLTLSGLPVGRYTARLTVTDGDGLVSLPSKPWVIEVAPIADGMALPVGTRVAGCHTVDAAAPEVRVVAGENRLRCGARTLSVTGEAAR